MKKLTKSMLGELALVMPVLSEAQERTVIGGGDGSQSNPYTFQEFEQMITSGIWCGGFVEGFGYAFSEVTVSGSSSGSGSSGSSGSYYDSGSFSGNYTTIPASAFSGYQSSDPQGCLRRCQEMLAIAGCTLSGDRIAMTEVGEGGIAGPAASTAVSGINAVNLALSTGQPIVVGVDYKQGVDNDGVTDHFIVITSCKTTVNPDGSSTVSYLFYDPATAIPENGTSPNNILVLNGSALTGSFGNKQYTVTTVRTNQ